MRLTGLWVYPVKSSAGQAIGSSRVTSRGLAGDRQWMVTDASGRFLTGREHPVLVRVRAVHTIDGLILEAPGLPQLQVRRAMFNTLRLTGVWSSRFEAYRGDLAADAWFSELLGIKAELLHIGGVSRRKLRADPSVRFGFADGYPVLLLNRASLDDLNDRLALPVTERNFRPNLVIDGAPAFAEDGWKRIRIGEVLFELMKPCERCVFTTVDPDTATLHPAQEPLRTLGSYRRTPAGVLFGQNLVARTEGILRLGDPVTLLE
jgi:uncharacterized protein YcbX